METSTLPELKAFKIHEPMENVYIGEMIFKDRPIISKQLLKDLQVFQKFAEEHKPKEGNTFLVLMGQKNSGIFNLGGDLELFHECIESRDRDQLAAYAKFGTKIMYETYASVKKNITTVSILNGTTAAGGFEFALACDFIIAEKGYSVTFSDTKLGFFPGGGAFEFLSKRMPANQAMKFILEGNVFSTEELFTMGIVDYLVEKGESEALLKKLVKQERKDQAKYNSLRKINMKTNPITVEDMLDSIEIWEECIMSLSKKHRDKIKRILTIQKNR